MSRTHLFSDLSNGISRILFWLYPGEPHPHFELSHDVLESNQASCIWRMHHLVALHHVCYNFERQFGDFLDLLPSRLESSP